MFYLHLQYSHTELGTLKATGMSPQGRCGFSRDWVMHCFTIASIFFAQTRLISRNTKNSFATWDQVLLAHKQDSNVFIPIRIRSQELTHHLSVSLQLKLLQAGFGRRPSKPETRRAVGRSLRMSTVILISECFRNTFRVQGWTEHSGLPWQQPDTLAWILEQHGYKWSAWWCKMVAVPEDQGSEL